MPSRSIRGSASLPSLACSCSTSLFDVRQSLLCLWCNGLDRVVHLVERVAPAEGAQHIERLLREALLEELYEAGPAKVVATLAHEYPRAAEAVHPVVALAVGNHALG